jgi:hypothetical protein
MENPTQKGDVNEEVVNNQSAAGELPNDLPLKRKKTRPHKILLPYPSGI